MACCCCMAWGLKPAPAGSWACCEAATGVTEAVAAAAAAGCCCCCCCCCCCHCCCCCWCCLVACSCWAATFCWCATAAASSSAVISILYPSPSGRKVLKPRISLLYPLNRFLTRSMTPLWDGYTYMRYYVIIYMKGDIWGKTLCAFHTYQGY